MRYYLAIGDPSTPSLRGGAPYYLSTEGKRQGLFDGAIGLDPQRLKMLRLAWNALQPLRFSRPGGFQYSRTFTNALFAQAGAFPKGINFVSIFPLLPPEPEKNGWRVGFYIDATLKQNFAAYGLSRRLGARIREEALARECRQYSAAENIICQGRWAAQSIVEDYKVDPDKVYVVPPGANLPDWVARDASTASEPPGSLGMLRLGMVGRDWRRKNLPMLLEVADVLKARGLRTEVHVIGPPKSELPSHPALVAHGYINKTRNVERFARIVRQWHFGCLLSDVEALGISLREFLFLGVPAVGRAVGGIPDAIPEGLGVLVDGQCKARGIAEHLAAITHSDTGYESLRAEVMSRRHEVSWAKAVEKLRAIWEGGGEPYSHDSRPC